MDSKAFVAALIVAGVLAGGSADASVQVSDAGARALRARIPDLLQTSGKRIITSKRCVSIVLIIVLLTLTRPVLGKSRSACSAPSPTVLTSTLTLTSANNGQSFSNYTISTTSGPCVKITGATNITLENFNIGPCGTNNSSADSTGVEIVGGSGSNVFDSYIHVQNLSSDGGDDHEGILINGASNVTVQGNVLAFNETNIEINGGTSAGDVINGNFMLNPMGPFPRGQQFQSGPGASNIMVENNRELSCQASSSTCAHSGDIACLACSNSTLAGDAFPYYANQEDANNFYGTTTFTASGNWIEGGDSPSGQGILFDSGSSGGTAIDNVLKDTGHACIGPYSAGATVVEGNKCETVTDIDPNQNGMYLYNPYSVTGTITAKDNTISVLEYSASGPCNPATSACGFNSYGDALGGNLTLNDLGGEIYDTLYPAAIGGGGGYQQLNQIASSNPPPPIPPLPKQCVVDSPYSQLSGATPTAKPTARLRATVTRTPTPTPTRTLTPWSTPTPEKWSWR